MTEFDRYERAFKAMQHGVAWEDANGFKEPTEARHLRAGVNAAMVAQTAMLRALIEKGFIDEARFMAILVCEMEQEVKRYELRMKAYTGLNADLYEGE